MLKTVSRLIVLLVVFYLTGPPPVMHLTIPAISLSQPVYPVPLIPEVPSWQVLDNYAGWHNLTPLPDKGGNIVLNGHSNIYGRVFRDLWRLQVGDRIYLTYQNKVYIYRVRWKVLVQEEGVTVEQRLKNGRWIQGTGDSRLTLVTCADGTKYRLIVVAFPK